MLFVNLNFLVLISLHLMDTYNDYFASVHHSSKVGHEL